MDKERILALVSAGQDEAARLAQQIGKPLEIDYKAFVTLARISYHMADGEGYMRTHVQALVDDLTRRDPDAPVCKFEYERQSL